MYPLSAIFIPLLAQHLANNGDLLALAVYILLPLSQQAPQSEVRELILATRQTVAQGVNSALVLLYWHIGQRIRSDMLQSKRAQYGAEILPTLSAKLVPDFGQGFSPRNLARMISLAEAFPDSRVHVTPSKKPAKLAAMALKQLREEDTLTPDLVFRDPYLLDFLGLQVALQAGKRS